MNKILSLFDEQFVLELLRQEVLPLYPAFTAIKQVDIYPYKELVWETTYHVVIGFNVYFLTPAGGIVKIPIVCSAHSSEPRENVYKALCYLWDKNLPGHGVDLPRPLFFSPEFNGTFYRGLKGENLLHFIKNKDQVSIKKIIIGAAELFAKLHALPVSSEANFNPANSRIKTVIPGVPHILQEITNRYGNKYKSDLEKIYGLFISAEEKFLSNDSSVSGPLSLIHGDAHPENILQTVKHHLGLIDFTDFCLGDFTRDLGSFVQQLEYKIINKGGDEVYAHQMKNLFLDTYFKISARQRTEIVEEHLQLYYNWTAIRTATYLFLKFDHDEARAAILLNQVKKNLGL